MGGLFFICFAFAHNNLISYTITISPLPNTTFFQYLSLPAFLVITAFFFALTVFSATSHSLSKAS